MIDRLDSRVLGAIRLVDVTTGTPLLGSLVISAAGVTGVRNRSGLFVLTHVDGFEDYEASFETAPPAKPGDAPVPVTVTLTASDPTGCYLPRIARVTLPRDADPANAGTATSLFTPLDVPMYPSPTAGADPGWALVRVSVRRQGTGDGLPGAFVRVVKATDSTSVLARGFADARGEAFVPIAGLPTVVWGATTDQPVLARDVDAVIEAYFDAATAGSPSDPETLEAGRAALPKATTAVKVSSGREVTALIELALP